MLWVCSFFLDALLTDLHVQAVERMRVNQAGILNRTFKLKQGVSAFTDIKVILLCLMSFCCTSAAAAVGTFGGLVIKQLYGATARRTLLLNLPASAIGAVVTVIGGMVAVSFPNVRIVVFFVTTLIVFIGCLLQWQLPLTERGGLLAGVWCGCLNGNGSFNR